MIASGSIELSHCVGESETALPITVDGKVLYFGLTAGTRDGPKRLSEFARELARILREGVLRIRIGDRFEKSVSIADSGQVKAMDLPRVRRGDEIRLSVAVAGPPTCSVALSFFVEIEEDAVKPALN